MSAGPRATALLSEQMNLLRRNWSVIKDGRWYLVAFAPCWNRARVGTGYSYQCEVCGCVHRWFTWRGKLVRWVSHRVWWNTRTWGEGHWEEHPVEAKETNQ